MVKGSALVQASQASADVQVKRDLVGKLVMDLEDWLSSRQTKDRRCVVFRDPKGYEATGRTHLSGFSSETSTTNLMVDYLKTQSCVRYSVKVT